MKVKFTEPIIKLVIFGTIVEMNDSHFLVQGDNGGHYMINPNSDYNFGFIPNEEANRKYAEKLNARVDELDALEKKSKKSY
jgi:hypothetical protein